MNSAIKFNQNVFSDWEIGFFQVHIERCWSFDADFVAVRNGSVLQSEFPVSVVVKAVHHGGLLIVVASVTQIFLKVCYSWFVIVLNRG